MIFFEREEELFDHTLLVKKRKDLILISMLGFAHNYSKSEIEKMILNYYKSA